MRKETISRIFRIFIIKHLAITWEVYSSYRLQLWCDDFLLYLQGIPCHAHFQFGWDERASQSCSKIADLCLIGSSLFGIGGLL